MFGILKGKKKKRQLNESPKKEINTNTLKNNFHEFQNIKIQFILEEYDIEGFLNKSF